MAKYESCKKKPALKIKYNTARKFWDASGNWVSTQIKDEEAKQRKVPPISGH